MSIDLSEIDKSIEQWNKHTFQEYKDWLFKQITSNQETSIFLKCHIENFLKNYKRQIGIEENFLLKKLFFIHLELKNHKEAFNILIKLIKTFGNDKKLLRMGSEEGEIDPKRGEVAIQRYKYMMINDQNDNESMKKYIMFMKLSVDLNDKQTINDYIDLWNQYLEAFMNDPDAYNELAQVYLMVNEYDKAAFCLEELLLYSPNNYKVLNKLGDIYASKNNAEDAKMGIKFYSRSILIQPTPRAFFGIQNCASIIIKKEKRLDDKTKNLVDISKKELTKLYADTEFKNFDVNKIFNV
jgi:tetratricopeptide (TPR) repeat protein